MLLTLDLYENFLASSKICVASSLVGARIRAKGVCLVLRPYPPKLPELEPATGPSQKILFRMGTKKAAVFPDPVCAQAIRSRLARITGIEFFCTGVGVVYCAISIFDWIIGVSATSSKDSMPLGTLLPVASTGISS